MTTIFGFNKAEQQQIIASSASKSVWSGASIILESLKSMPEIVSELDPKLRSDRRVTIS